jgi:hypothetical protein
VPGGGNLDPNAQLQMAGIAKQAGFNWLKHQVEWQSVGQRTRFLPLTRQWSRSG